MRIISRNDLNLPDRTNLLIQAIESMKRFAVNSGYFETGNKGGCHICLNINHSNTIGYLRLRADNFYKISPNREIFLENFKNLNNFYVET